MFTGIIEEKAKIKKIVKGKTIKFDIASSLNVNSGDSVSIQGVCLTVNEVHNTFFSVETTTQTRDATTIPFLKTRDYVNLERAMSLNGRIGGHIMLGHVDEVGRLVRIVSNSYYFQVNSKNAKYLIPKGSVGIDGVSLTISTISGNVFSVALIPFTQKNTTLSNIRVGSRVNIEYDYLVKILKSQS